jgi:hypothetical protein
MAIKPIKRYGKFTPTGVDKSDQARLEALAGIGKTVSDAAMGLGQISARNKQQEINKQEASKKLQAELDAPQAGYQEGGTAATTGVYTPTLGYGAKRRQTAAQAGYIASFENTMNQTIQQAVVDAKGDPQAFRKTADGALSGMLQAYNNLPQEWRNKAELSIRRKIDLAEAPILKKYNAIQLEKNEAEYAQSQADRATLESNLAFNGNFEALSQERETTMLSVDAAIEGGIKIEKINVNTDEHLSKLRLQISRGMFHRQFIETEAEITSPADIAQRVRDGEATIDRLRNQEAMYINDPNNTEGKTLISKEEQGEIVKALQTDLKAFADRQTAILDNKTQADKIDSIKATNDMQEQILGDELDTNEKLVLIAEQEIISGVSGEKLRRYVNARDKLENTTNPETYTPLLQMAHDLNAQYTMTGESEDYLVGLGNLNELIMDAVIKGEISQVDEVSLRKQLATLTTAKLAGATAEVADTWSKHTNQLKDLAPASYYNTSVRLLFNSVQAQITEAEENPENLDKRGNLNRDIVNSIWEQTTPRIIDAVKQMESNDKQTLLRSITDRPLITTQAQYDKLPSGSLYFNVNTGKNGTKP